MRFDGVSRSELIEFIHQLETERNMLKRLLESSLRDERQCLEKLTTAQERGTKLALELQAIKAQDFIVSRGPGGPP